MGYYIIRMNDDEDQVIKKVQEVIGQVLVSKIFMMVIFEFQCNRDEMVQLWCELVQEKVWSQELVLLVK